jgi:2-polyprenyl-6-methoxyphenol hydroxylase-like FAD-dependent oxidoreductase
MEMTYLTIPRSDGDTDWWRWYNAPGGLAVTLRPDRHGTTRAVLTSIVYSGSDSVVPTDRRSAEEQKTHLREQFSGVGWEAARVLDALDGADDMYFESIGQVHAPAWSAGRVALTGDAALVRVADQRDGHQPGHRRRVRAGRRARSHVDHRDAFAGYDRMMRPYVNQAQKLPPGVPRILNPRTRVGLGALRLGLRIASSRPAKRLGAQLFSPPAEQIDLPDYRHLEHSAKGIDLAR